MIERLQENLSERLRDCLEVCIPNGLILASVNLLQVNHLVQIVGGLVTVGYAVWRWRRDSFVICQACRDGRPPEICPLPSYKRPCWCPRKLT
jgi:hypothetical protein